MAAFWVDPNLDSKRRPSAITVYTAVHSILLFPYILDRGSCWRGSLRVVSNYTKYRTNVFGDRGQVDHRENPVTLQYRSALGVILYSILGIPEVSLSQAGDSNWDSLAVGDVVRALSRKNATALLESQALAPTKFSKLFTIIFML